MSGNIETVKILVENGLDINTKLEGEFSLLETAKGFSNYEICEYLVANGADVNVNCNFGNNLLTNITTFPLLITKKEKAYLKIVKLLVDSGCNINHVNYAGFTPIIRAVKNLDYELCKYLIENGADVNYKHPDYYSALHLICIICCERNETYETSCYKNSFFNELYEICVLLVENGADLLEKDHNGFNSISTHWLNFIDPLRNEAENTIKYKVYMIRLKIKTYLEDKIQECEMMKTCFKRAQIEDYDTD
jgi:ankyrin repeat protein